MKNLKEEPYEEKNYNRNKKIDLCHKNNVGNNQGANGGTQEVEDSPKTYQKQLSTRFGVVIYDDRKTIPKALIITTIMLLHRGHAANSKMTATAKLFWRQRITRDVKQKCEECIPCKMAGKNIKPQLLTTYHRLTKQTKKSNWL